MRRAVVIVGGIAVYTGLRVCAEADTSTTIATDRPAVAESSTVVPQGSFQLESGLLATDSAGHYLLDFPEADLRYGLTSRTEVRLSLPDYFHAAGGGRSGFGDTAIGAKQQLGPLQGWDLSLIAFVTLPTGADSQSGRHYDPGVQLPWSHALTTAWTLAGQLAFYWPTPDGQRNNTGEATILIDRQLTAPWDAFIEYAGDFPRFGGSSQLLHVGTAYKLSARQQIDLHAAAGLSSAAPRSFIGVGYSYLFLSN